jgi:hypothetical protein
LIHIESSKSSRNSFVCLTVSVTDIFEGKNILIPAIRVTPTNAQSAHFVLLLAHKTRKRLPSKFEMMRKNLLQRNKRLIPYETNRKFKVTGWHGSSLKRDGAFDEIF